MVKLNHLEPRWSIQDYDVILVKNPPTQPSQDTIGPLSQINQPVDHRINPQIRRGSVGPIGMTSGTFPGGQRGSLAKIHDMKNEAPITKVHTQVFFSINTRYFILKYRI